MKARTCARISLVGLALFAVLAAGFVMPSSAKADDRDWLGEYYTNRWLSGAPVLVRENDPINFDWGDGSPDGAIPSDNFSVRWTRTINVTSEGTFRFKVHSDDGVRLYVDDTLLIDAWTDGAGENSAKIALNAGTHALRLEYYEHKGDASVSLSWGRVSDEEIPVGNIITCVGSTDSWIKVYRWDGSTWIDVNPNGYGALSASGTLKLDGMLVDTDTYGGNGHPYRVELWQGGSLVAAVGDAAAGQSEFRVYTYTDNYTPWSCSS